MDFGSILRDVTPGVALLIAILYIVRESLGVIREQQRQQSERDKVQEAFTRELLSLIAEFPVAMRNLNESQAQNLQQRTVEHTEIMNALNAQTLILQKSLQSNRTLEQTVTTAADQLSQDK